MENKVLRCLYSGTIPLIFGPTGIGKTTASKKISRMLDVSKTHHLFCPLEPNEFDNMLMCVNNNPHQLIIIDNIEAADTSSLKQIIGWISRKLKATKIILVCVNPYDILLRTIRSKTTLISMPSIKTDDMIIKANNHAASNNAIELIAKSYIQDYRLLRNVILNNNSASYDKDTNIALRNPFKAFSWLLNTDDRHSANLTAIIDHDPFFYSMGIFTNFPKVSNNIYDIEAYSSSLSDIDALGYNVSQYQNHLLAMNNCYINNKKRQIDIAFPNFTFSANHKDKRWKSQEHMDMLGKKFNLLNLTSSKKNTEEMRQLVTTYALSVDCVEKSMKKLGVHKQTKLKAHLKRAFL